MIPASSSTGVDPDEKSLKDNEKLAERKRKDKIITRWRIIVGTFFVVLLAVLLFYVVKGINGVINRSSPTEPLPGLSYNIHATTEPDSFSPQAYSLENVIPVGGGDNDNDNDQPAVLGASTTPRGSVVSAPSAAGSPAAAQCPDYVGDQYVCVADQTPGKVASRPLGQTPNLLSRQTRSANFGVGPVPQTYVFPPAPPQPAPAQCPDYVGDQFACVADNTVNHVASQDPIY